MDRYVPNPGAVAALAATPQMQRAMLAAAQPGVAFARAASPQRTGRFASSFEVEAATIDGMAAARLVNRAPYSVYVEWTNGTHVLARAVDAIEGSS